MARPVIFPYQEGSALSTKTPHRADALRNRQKVLATAEAMFATVGLDVSIEDIAREAKIGVGTVYRNFPTKHALVAEIANARAVEFVRDIEQRVAAPYAPTALREIVERMSDHAARKRHLLDALGGSKWTDGPEFEPLRARIRSALTTLVERAQQAHELRDDLSVSDLIVLVRGLFAPDLDSRTRTRLLRVLFEGLRPVRASRAADEQRADADRLAHPPRAGASRSRRTGSHRRLRA
jgi:AcrR family transcriptional regulator